MVHRSLRSYHLLAAVFGFAVLTACASESPSAPKDEPPPELTALPRALTAQETQVRDAANAFSFSLWERVNQAQSGKNVFLSPLSASFALGMTMNGAAGTTQSEMQQALAFGTASQAEINDGYKSLIALLTSLDPTVDMRIGNSIWYRRGFPVRQSFLETTREYFGATSEGLDFSNPASLTTINGWASAATNQKIPEVIDEIDPDIVMFLINAIYFKGDWRAKFDPAQTRPATFRGAANTTQPMQLMTRTGEMRYLEGATFQAVELPYGNGAFVMNVVLPAEGIDIDAFAASLNPALLDGNSYQSRDVELSLPKLRLEYERVLNGDLQAMGMQRAFSSGGADFTGMAPPPTGHALSISYVKQNTFVDIHEEGTEAAAVTVVAIRETSAPMRAVMRVDRPYIFVIRERLSGTVLFMGKIVQMPQAG